MFGNNQFTNQANGPTGGFGATQFQSSSAMLWIYSPRTYGTQVIRPYIYNITDNMIDKLVEAPDMRQAIGRGGLMKDKEFSQIIKPEAAGVQVDMSVLNECWTGLLQIDLPRSRNALGIAGVGACVRLMCSGWFDRPPYLEYTLSNSEPTVDPNAIFNVTHHTIMRIGESISPMMGAISNKSIQLDDDIVSGILPSMTNTDLYICGPGDTSNGVMDIGMNSMGEMERTNVSGLSAITPKTVAPIPTRLKSPKHHVQEIITALHSAVEAKRQASAAVYSDVSELSNSSFDKLEDPVGDVMHDFKASMIHINGSPISTFGIDVSAPFTLGYLDGLYPNIRVFGFRIPRTAQLDVIPQTEISAKVQFSSMVAAAISSYAVGSGLSSIKFAFRTHRNAFGINTLEDLFQLGDVPLLLCPSNDPVTADRQLEAAVYNFRHSLINDITPILLNAGGEFEMFAIYEIGTETSVNLHFLDNMISTEGSGYYETSNRLPIVCNPILGPEQAFIRNGESLNILGNAVACKNFLTTETNKANYGLIESPMNNNLKTLAW